jgi:hypothetical protein
MGECADRVVEAVLFEHLFIFFGSPVFEQAIELTKSLRSCFASSFLPLLSRIFALSISLRLHTRLLLSSLSKFFSACLPFRSDSRRCLRSTGHLHYRADLTDRIIFLDAILVMPGMRRRSSYFEIIRGTDRRTFLFLCSVGGVLDGTTFSMHKSELSIGSVFVFRYFAILSRLYLI